MIISLLLTSVFCQCLSWSKWTTFLVSISKKTVLENLYGLYIHDIRPKRRKNNKVFSSTSIIKFLSIVGSIETWSKQSRFYFLRYSAVACHKLSHLIHGYSYLVPLEILEGYKKLRRFPGTKVNLSVLLGKPDITYRGTLNTESLEPSCRISPEPRTMLKILYFSGGHQFSQISLRIKFLYDRVENLFIYWLGKHNLWPGR